jgi:hypothetical protein
MQARTAREDQAEDILNGRQQTYKAFVTSTGKHWLTVDDRAECRQGLETSMRNARDPVQIIDVQPAISPALQGLRGKLVLWAE